MELDFFSQGKEYISASRAAKRTGYAGDYIGQLCRTGKIPGKLIERTWYVDLDSLLAHKRTRQLGKPRRAPELPVQKAKENIALKIQAVPVEISLPAPAGNAEIRYEKDTTPLLPLIARKSTFSSMPQGARIISAKAYVFVALPVLFIFATTLAFPHASARQGEKIARQATAAEVTATSIFAALSGSATHLAESFEDLQNLAFSALHHQK